MEEGGPRVGTGSKRPVSRSSSGILEIPNNADKTGTAKLHLDSSQHSATHALTMVSVRSVSTYTTQASLGGESTGPSDIAAMLAAIQKDRARAFLWSTNR